MIVRSESSVGSVSTAPERPDSGTGSAGADALTGAATDNAIIATTAIDVSRGWAFTVISYGQLTQWVCC